MHFNEYNLTAFETFLIRWHAENINTAQLTMHCMTLKWIYVCIYLKGFVRLSSSGNTLQYHPVAEKDPVMHRVEIETGLHLTLVKDIRDGP